MPSIVDEYKKWRYPPDSSLQQESISSDYTFTVNVLDVYTLSTTIEIMRKPSSTSIVVDMIAHGYLSSSPISPTVAISLKMLELFQRLRLRKPSFSVEAFAQVVCDLYGVCNHYSAVFGTSTLTYL